jgi:hypothetical protein
MGAVRFAEGVVEEAGQDVHLLSRTAQALEEPFLRLAIDHEVGAGDQHWVGRVMAWASATTRSAASYRPSRMLTEMARAISGSVS